MSKLDRTTFVRLREMTLNLNPIFLCARSPLRLKSLLVPLIFGQSRAMREVLRRFGAGQSFPS
jgi:hypothetical protein